MEHSVFDYGIPSTVFSDLGSQITSAGKQIEKCISSEEFKLFLDESQTKAVRFEQYFKGDSSLGSTVEICVKFANKTVLRCSP